MYTNQTAQVKWHNTRFITTSIKQGGVLSPILFMAYMDSLLFKLRTYCIGCRIGNKYCGSFGYVDDTISLNPSAYSCRLMLICEELSSEFNKMFNPDKTCRLNKDDETANITFRFNGAIITISENEKHLGTYIGKVLILLTAQDNLMLR